MPLVEGGEAQHVEFSSTWMDSLQNLLTITWTEPKTAQKYALKFVPSKYNKESYLCDVFHSLGTYWAMDKGLLRNVSSFA